LALIDENQRFKQVKEIHFLAGLIFSIRHILTLSCPKVDLEEASTNHLK